MAVPKTNPDMPPCSAVDDLRQVLTNSSADTRQWARTLDAALAEVEHELQQCLAATADDKFPAEIKDAGAARKTAQLMARENDLLTQVMLVRRQATRPRSALVNPPRTSHEDFERVRQAAQRIVARLEQNQATENKLIQESFNTDIGVGD